MNYEHNKFNIKILSVIAYLGPLFIAGKLSVEKNQPDVKFHCNQGFILFCFEITFSIFNFLICTIISQFTAAKEIIGTLLFVAAFMTSVIMSIMGVSSAFKNQKKPLPFIGNINNYFKR